MTATRCPHCQAMVEDASTFCATCGRRVAGWSAAPLGGEPVAPLPGGEEPTRGMEVTPSLLRAASLPASKKKKPAVTGPVETDSALMRAVKRNRVPVMIVLSLLAVGAGALGFVLVRRSATPAAPPSAPSIATAAVPDVATPPPPIATPGAPVIAPRPPAPAKSGRHSRGPHRVEPITMSKSGKVVEAPAAPAPPRSVAGGLPHKTVPTDSKMAPSTAAPAAPPASPAATAAVQGEGVQEATPQTEAEMKQEAEARIDADSVRFVVKSHIAQVHACYERAFKDSSPGGRIELGFAIDSNGRAVRVRTEANSTDSEGLARCLESRVREWQFPRPVGGEYELIYPFVFSAGS